MRGPRRLRRKVPAKVRSANHFASAAPPDPAVHPRRVGLVIQAPKCTYVAWVESPRLKLDYITRRFPEAASSRGRKPQNSHHSLASGAAPDNNARLTTPC
jgi:hypothetical protein